MCGTKAMKSKDRIIGYGYTSPTSVKVAICVIGKQ